MGEPGSGRRRALRVLLIAEAANPEWVSVPLVGWSHARALARRVDAHLVTQVRNRGAIERAGLSPEEFTAIDSERMARLTWRLGKLLRGGEGRGWTTTMALSALSYPDFERRVWRRFRDRLRAGEFDLVHRLTPLSPTLPSLLAGRCARAGVPFLLGPLNGGTPWPRGFDRARRREREWLSYVRSAYKLLPGYRSTRANAAAIIVGSRDTLAQLPARYHAKAVYVPENAIDPERFSPPPPRPAPPPLRVAFLGRLVPYKGADMLLEAAAPLLRTGRVALDLIGDGPEREALERQARELGLGEAVAFAGWLDHRRVQERLGAAHVLGFPSIREFGGGVVMEAMALGVVPVVVAHGGPAEIVTAATGVAIPVAPRERIVADLRAALEGLADDPDRLASLAARGRERVERHFTWEAKARQVVEIYRWVRGERDKPDFGMPLPDV